MMVYIISFLYITLGISFALSPTRGFDVQILRLAVPVSVLVWFLYCAYRQKITIPHGVIAFFVFLILLWDSISLFFSAVPLWTMRKLLFLYTLAPLFIVLYDLFVQQKKNVVRITQALVIGASISAVIGLVQFFAQFIFSHDVVAALWAQLTPFFLGGTFSQSVAQYNSWYVHVAGRDLLRAIAFFPDPHVFSFYMGASIPFGVALYQKTKKPLWLVATLLLFLADLLTFSRGGEVALLVGVLAMGVLFFPRHSLRVQHMISSVGIIFMIGFIIFGGLFFERFLSSFDPADTSATTRIVLWQDAMRTVYAYPIAGVGLGAYAHHINPRADYRLPLYAHNTPLDIAVETGLVGLALWSVLIFFVLVAFWRARKEFFARAGLVSIIILGVHGMFDTAIFSVHVFLVMIFFIALSSYYETSLRT